MLDIDIMLTDHPKPKPEDETSLGFGKVFSDHMFVMDYEKDYLYEIPEIKDAVDKISDITKISNNFKYKRHGF